MVKTYGRTFLLQSVCAWCVRVETHLVKVDRRAGEDEDEDDIKNKGGVE